MGYFSTLLALQTLEVSSTSLRGKGGGRRWGDKILTLGQWNIREQEKNPFLYMKHSGTGSPILCTADGNVNWFGRYEKYKGSSKH